MNFISGVPAVVIPNEPISEEDRNKFNSFETKISGYLMQDGKYLGAVSCGGSSIGHDDCVFTRGTPHETSDDAMRDAGQLLYDLRGDDEE